MGSLPGAGVHFCMTPQPWPRTGPGTAWDGKPRFDLSAFDRAYFGRLRERVVAARRTGSTCRRCCSTASAFISPDSDEHRGPPVPRPE